MTLVYNDSGEWGFTAVICLSVLDVEMPFPSFPHVIMHFRGVGFEGGVVVTQFIADCFLCGWFLSRTHIQVILLDSELAPRLLAFLKIKSFYPPFSYLFTLSLHLSEYRHLFPGLKWWLLWVFPTSHITFDLWHLTFNISGLSRHCCSF